MTGAADKRAWQYDPPHTHVSALEMWPRGPSFRMQGLDHPDVLIGSQLTLVVADEVKAVAFHLHIQIHHELLEQLAGPLQNQVGSSAALQVEGGVLAEGHCKGAAGGGNGGLIFGQGHWQELRVPSWSASGEEQRVVKGMVERVEVADAAEVAVASQPDDNAPCCKVLPLDEGGHLVLPDASGIPEVPDVADPFVVHDDT